MCLHVNPLGGAPLPARALWKSCEHWGLEVENRDAAAHRIRAPSAGQGFVDVGFNVFLNCLYNRVL